MKTKGDGLDVGGEEEEGAGYDGCNAQYCLALSKADIFPGSAWFVTREGGFGREGGSGREGGGSE